MNIQQIKNNHELFEYLVWPGGELKSKGQPELSEEVRHASHSASGSPSEFLDEAQEVLKRVKDQCLAVLRKL